MYIYYSALCWANTNIINNLIYVYSCIFRFVLAIAVN